MERTRKVLAEQGFGVLTEIDMKSTLKAKLGAEMKDYLILGACNPPLAHRVITVDRQIGFDVPLQLVVRANPTADGIVIVEAMNSRLLVQVSGEADLAPVADDVTARLRSAVDSLAESQPPSAAW